MVRYKIVENKSYFHSHGLHMYNDLLDDFIIKFDHHFLCLCVFVYVC